MKLVKNDIEQIKNSYNEAQQVFDSIKAEGKSISSFILNQIDTIKANPLNKDNNLDVLGRILYFREQMMTADVEDQDLTFENSKFIEKEFSNTLLFDEHYYDLAKACIEEPEFVNYLPDLEFEELDKNKIKEKTGVDFDEELDLDKKAENAVREENQTRINQEIENEKNDVSLMGLCSHSIILDNTLFRALDTNLSTKIRELNPHVGNRSIDDVVNDFNSLDERFYDNVDEARIAEDEENQNEREQNSNRIINDAKDIAAQKIACYLAAKHKKDSRTLGDKLLHPFRSIKEHFAVKRMENKIKEDYILTDANLKEIKDITSTNRGVSDIGIFKRDNTKLFTTPTREQIENKKEEIVNEGYEQTLLADQQLFSQQLNDELKVENKEISEFTKENDLSKVNNLEKDNSKDDIKVD